MKKNKKNRIIFGLWKASSGCSKCGSKDVYYSLQKKIIFYVTQYGSPIVNETEHRYHFIKTQKEMSLIYLNALQLDETELCLRTCRNCNYSEVIDGSELDEEENEEA